MHASITERTSSKKSLGAGPIRLIDLALKSIDFICSHMTKPVSQDSDGTGI